ncbi:O-methyltransferase [Bradyrhizobium genosp. P]|uniref:O-methyltransferase n=1 Tax=Bradyrhizobium genosp. P TaxID=83641 RepID=UPI003CF99624
MDREVEAVLAGYDQRAAVELALMQELTPEEMLRRVDEFLIPIGPDAGRLLNLIIRSSQARTILELGTSYGYSTIFFAEAARACQGKVISVDINADKQRYANEHLTAAGLDSFVEFVTGDAREVVASLPGPFDFVLIDLWKDLYVPCFDLVHPKLSEGAFVAADNILHPEFFRAEMTAYRQHVQRQAGFESILLPVGNGIELSRYTGNTAQID